MSHKAAVSVVVTLHQPGERLAETLRALLEQRPDPLSLRLLDARPKPQPVLAGLGLDDALARELERAHTTVAAAPDRHPGALRAQALSLCDSPLAVLLDAECTPASQGFVHALLEPLRTDAGVALALGRQTPHERCDALGKRQLEALHAPLSSQPRARIADGAGGWTQWTRELHALCTCDLACAAIRVDALRRLQLAQLPGDPARELADERLAQAVLEAGWTRVYAAEAEALRTYAAPPATRLAALRSRAAALKKQLIAPAPAALVQAPVTTRPERSGFLTAAARLAQKSARAAEVLRDEGAQAVFERLRRPAEAAEGPWWDQHPYDLLREPRRAVPPPAPSALSAPLTISFVVPAFFKGSGGHTTIFRLAQKLEALGHTCQLVFTSTEGLLPQVPVQVRQLVQELFVPLRARVFLHHGDPLPDADVHVATHWDTAYVVDRRRRSGAAAYLVQDWEPGFFPIGTASALVEETYRLGFQHVCAGPWLEQRLRSEFQARASHFLLGVEPSDYFVPEAATAPPAGGRIAVYLRPFTARRGFELVALALAEVKRQRPQLEVSVYGSDPTKLDLPFEAHKRGVLAHAELRALYASSTLGLSCSLSNYSLVPQEMMACGLPVVEIDAPSTRALFEPERDVVLAPPAPLGYAAAILRLLDDAELRATLRQSGLQRVRALTWDAAAKQLESGLRKAVAHALGV
ncbi:MAG: glycosyltransferase [Deltaproteobacteria bacterium]|nr:glycosyltransferase [Deltaproteobacteria bacterium]